MQKNITSIRSRLIKWLTIPLALFALVLSIYIYSLLNNKVNNFFDNRLYASAKSIESNIGIANNKLIIDLPTFSIDLLSTFDEGLVYYSVVNEKGDLLVGHKYLFNRNRINEYEKTFFNVTYDGAYLRVVSYPTYFYSSGKEYIAYVTLGETTEERKENISETIIMIFIIMGIVFFSTIVITLIAVNQGLKPLNILKVGKI